MFSTWQPVRDEVGTLQSGGNAYKNCPYLNTQTHSRLLCAAAQNTWIVAFYLRKSSGAVGSWLGASVMCWRACTSNTL